MITPLILFAYARPEHLSLTLACLRENNVPLIYAFSDGLGKPAYAPAVNEVRRMLREINWCEVILCEREINFGLGRSVLAGVTEVLTKHEMCIVFEDDLICVPGTYQYLCAALNHYRSDHRVMSVTGWTHPRVTPNDVTNQPYFDGRAECWVWGTWARAWHGIMDHTALDYVRLIELRGHDPAKYGDDLVKMADMEIKINIWAVRFFYHQIANKGLCLRPPWSMVRHIGFDCQGTNAKVSNIIDQPLPAKPPDIPDKWPDPIENPACSVLWREFCQLYTMPVQKNRLAMITRLMKQALVRGMPFYKFLNTFLKNRCNSIE